MSPNLDGRFRVAYGNQNWNTTYRGAAPEYSTHGSGEVQRDTIFTYDDVERAVPVCILGQTVVENLFPDESPVGKNIRLQAMPMPSNGVSQPKGEAIPGCDQNRR